ncbi:MAG: hypothetical protein FWC92_06700 [Defluviitaleaceae bacterium]|nr:hypothetical protein [Defluviitaleaceae bacterium]
MLKKLITLLIIFAIALFAAAQINDVLYDEPALAELFSDAGVAIRNMFTSSRTNDSITITTASTTYEKYQDVRRNPSNWEMTDSASEPATSREAPGGIATEEEWTHIPTGVKVYIHDVRTVYGISIDNHPHPRAYPVLLRR